MIKIVGENCTAAEVLGALRQAYRDKVVVGLDTETKGIDPRKESAAGNCDATIVCWSLSIPNTEFDKVFLWGDQLEPFTKWLESDALKCGHNIFGFDKHMFANHGIKLMGVAGDTMRMSRLLYSCKLRQHGLKALSLYWLEYEQPAFKDLFMRWKHATEYVQETKKSKGVVTNLEYRETKRKVGETAGVPTILMSGERSKVFKVKEFIPLDEIPRDYPNRLQALYDYASADAWITARLYVLLKQELEKIEWIIAK